MTRLVLFDLDGTLLDTGPDIAAALNRVRAEHGLDPVPYAPLRACVSHGAAAVVRCGFPDADEATRAMLRTRLLAHYAERLADQTALFPGMDAVLAALEDGGLRWGVVTNKPGWLTGPLLDRLGLAPRAACIVSGDTTPHLKPHPAPVLRACRACAVAPADAWYVGDAERDVQAGRAAGSRTAVALFGYVSDDDRPQDWGADALLTEPSGLLALVGAAARERRA